MEDNSNNDIFQAYEQTVVEIYQSEKQLSELDRAEYFVITAWNPYSQELSLTENRRRNDELQKELMLSGAVIHRAIGRSDDWKWFEESYAVQKIGLIEIVNMAKKYQQNAIFQISSGVKKVISCID